MAVLCLSSSLRDLKERLGKMIVGYTYDGEPVTASMLNAEGAMAALLKDALKPNLVQTLEGTPALVHGGPFANIAHGCNSVIATKTALGLGEYAVTEAGFGADLGAEKFLDIKCRSAGLRPSAVVIVATVRALKMHGGVPKDALDSENLPALGARHSESAASRFEYQRGIRTSLRCCGKSLSAGQRSGACACRNAMQGDGRARRGFRRMGQRRRRRNGFGARGRPALRGSGRRGAFRYCYEDSAPLDDKLNAIVRKIYHGKGFQYTAEAQKQKKQLEAAGFADLPVCVAKTQYSFSDDAAKLGAPEDFEITVRSLRLSAGAGFIVALTGSVMTMPGLPKSPAAERIDIDENGNISGLF